MTSLNSKRPRIDSMAAPLPRIHTLESVPRIAIHDTKYVTLPGEFTRKCGCYVPNNDVMLYARLQVVDLWQFLQEKVIAGKMRGVILGPRGVGKSLALLSFATSLDPDAWNVVWVHLGGDHRSDRCVMLGTKEWWLCDVSNFPLPRVAGKRLFLFLDGYTGTSEQCKLSKDVLRCLRDDDRLVYCYATDTTGKTNSDDDFFCRIESFRMYSWTEDEYREAISDPAFHASVESMLDGDVVSDVYSPFLRSVREHDQKSGDGQGSGEDKLALKYYYAGGSCRFMFGCSTMDVVLRVKDALHNARNAAELVEYCGKLIYAEGIDTLYGMYDQYGRCPVSKYVVWRLAWASSEQSILTLASKLRLSTCSWLDGHLLEWLLLVTLPRREVVMVNQNGETLELEKAPVVPFDPTVPFVRVEDEGDIEGDQQWLTPVAWIDGGYDAVYFDQDQASVTFIQVARSDQRSLDLAAFHNVLSCLEAAGMDIQVVVLILLVKPALLGDFDFASVADFTSPREANRVVELVTMELAL